MDTANTKDATALAGPRLPADQGLSSLGLIMQLVGSISLGLMAYLMLLPLFSGGAAGGWQMLLLGASGIIRAAFHRSAGGALLYGGHATPRRALRTYLYVSIAETAIWVFVMLKTGVPVKTTIPMIAMLLSWPVTLTVVTSRPRFQAVLDEIPQSEDLGFEGAGVLMLILGLIGTLFSGFVLYAMLKLPGAVFSSPQALLVFGVFAMLVGRSVLQTIAGYRATSGVSSDEASDAAGRYFNFGVVSSVIAAGAVLVNLMMGMHYATSIMVGLVFVGFALCCLLIWPLLLRRFYTERNFSVLLAGDESGGQRRVPDTGMTTLGWILLGSAVYGLSSAVPHLLLGTGSGDPFGIFFGAGLMGEGQASPWWQIGIAGVELWAGIELINMSDRYRIAATIYGLAAAAATLFIAWPMIKNGLGGSEVFALGRQSSMFKLIAQAGIAVGLVIPVVTIILANRKITPQATARIKS